MDCAVAWVLSAVWALTSRSTCVLRAMFCAAADWLRELPEMFCTRLAIWFETCSISCSAATATKQIDVLVRTIQTDTNEAVVSMERSTTDVVGGALLAENAGAALQEIEHVSNQIASLVQNISSSARSQSTAAQNIARNMQVLREISAQASDATHANSSSVLKLADLSAALRKSVAGFRLPEPVGTGTHRIVTLPGGSSKDATGQRPALTAAPGKAASGQ